MQPNKLSKFFWLLLLLASSGFTLIFSGIRFNFWVQMGVMAGGLAILAVLNDPVLRQQLFKSTRYRVHSTQKDGDRRREAGVRIVAGFISAFVLYAIFWCGNLLSRQWFGFADTSEGVA